MGGAPSYASSALTFNSIINLSNNSGASTAPVIAVVGSHVYVAWEDKSINGKQAQTFFRSSNNSGSTFGPTLEFTGLPGAANNQLDSVQIAAEGQYVFLTWQQGGATAFANSSNFGARFGWRIISSSAPAGFMTGQTIAANGTNVYVSWSDSETATGNQEIFFVASHDGGKTFTIPAVVSTGASGGPISSHVEEDQIAATGKYVYIVWDAIWFTVSNDTGTTFFAPVNLRSPNCSFPCLSREPMISTSGTNVYVTFPSDNTTTLSGSGPYHTYVVVSHDNGKTFALLKDLSTALSNTREVQVSSNGTNVYVTSRGLSTVTKGTQQYVYVSHDSGNTFAAPLLLASLSGPENGFGGVAVNGTNVFVAWPHGTPSQLFVDASQDSGSTWAGDSEG